MTENIFQDMAKTVQYMGKATGRLNKSLAKVFLSMPIPMNYETWSFLHEIADGDDVEIDLNECGDVE